VGGAAIKEGDGSKRKGNGGCGEGRFPVDGGTGLDEKEPAPRGGRRERTWFDTIAIRNAIGKMNEKALTIKCSKKRDVKTVE